MTPDALRARLAALRAAGEELRRRPAHEVIEALAAVLDRWRDREAPERRALESQLPALTGFAAATVREGLARGLAPWSGAALRALALGELGGAGRVGSDTSAVLLAGSIPLPTLLGVIAPLALRSPVLAKTATRDPLTAQLVAHSLAAVDAGLGRCVEIVAFPGDDAACMEVFLSAACVVATGSDATIAAVERRVRPPQRLLRHGHGLSIAVLGPAAARGDALARAAHGLAVDTALWDQLGCLSPIGVYVVGDTALAARVGAALARALDDVGQTLPRGAVDAHAAALAAHERAGAELRAAAGRPVVLHSAADASWTVVCEEDAAVRPAPLHRFLRVHPVHSPQRLVEALAPLAHHLAGAALAGFGDDQPDLAQGLRRLGASWVCAPGQLQSPPLDWPRDGLPALGSLAQDYIPNY